MIEILPPALGLEVFRATAHQAGPFCDGYALVMLRAASLRWPRRRRHARTALGGGLLAPRTWLTPRVQQLSKRIGWRITAPSGRSWYVAEDVSVYINMPGSFKVERTAAPLVFEEQPSIGDVLARLENQNGRFKAVATAGGVAVKPDEESEGL